MQNDHVVMNLRQVVSVAGFVNTVSIQYCTLPSTAQPILWVYVIEYTGTYPYFITRSMFAIPSEQVSLTNALQEYTLPNHRLNVSVGHYIAVGFGKTTGGSPCRAAPGDGAYTNLFGGANQTFLASIQGSCFYYFQTQEFSIGFTTLSPV